MYRADFQKLARTRLREAKILCQAREPSAAFYLTGLAVECALKAAFCKNVRKFRFPDKSDKELFTHDLNKLRKFAGLTPSYEERCSEDENFEVNWAVVVKWSVESRYCHQQMVDARDILRAATMRRHGVMQWIREHW